MPTYSCLFLTLRGRIYDGKGNGVIFREGGKGRVLDCQIWGNEDANVGVRDSGSQAVVKACECANAGLVP